MGAFWLSRQIQQDVCRTFKLNHSLLKNNHAQSTSHLNLRSLVNLAGYSSSVAGACLDFDSLPSMTDEELDGLLVVLRTLLTAEAPILASSKEFRESRHITSVLSTTTFRLLFHELRMEQVFQRRNIANHWSFCQNQS